MAKITLGLWTTHGPTLSTTPEQWLMRLPADHARKNHSYRGGTYEFNTLVTMRAGEGFAEQASLASGRAASGRATTRSLRWPTRSSARNPTSR